LARSGPGDHAGSRAAQGTVQNRLSYHRLVSILARRSRRTTARSCLSGWIAAGLGAAALVLPAVSQASPASGSAVQSGAATPAHPKEQRHELLSKSFRVDRIFESMRGPFAQRKFALEPGAPKELVWLTGYAVEVVDAAGKTPASLDFECHTNLAYPRKAPTPAGFHRPKNRIFTLTQGQVDIRLPPGFGIPTLSSELLTFNTQVLNLNRPEIDERVRHRAELRYVRDRDLDGPMKPLIATAAQVLVTLEDEPAIPGVEGQPEHLEGASCAVGEPETARSQARDPFGRRFTSHWVVPPGRHEYRTLITKQLKIPYDTTVHFIGVHAHPHSVALELQDVTTGKSLFLSRQTSHADRLGIEFLEYYSSEEGIPIYADHDYQLISTYENPTEAPSDSMAVMYLYYLDKQFEGGSRF
jgi:hypothetical protein